MLVTVDITAKSMGNKELLKNVQFSIEAREKIAIIGRNGVGKSTLFGLLAGIDKDYAGTISYRNGIRVVATRQEHHDVDDLTVSDYIVTHLPEYAKLKRILDTYPETMGDDMRKITIYSEALERFSQLDYYTVEERVKRSLDDYQLGNAAQRLMKTLSGGQKRFVELIRVEYSDADLALIDEPTNHMDYLAKEAFLRWFEATKHAVVVITHDRDLLSQVTRIIEIKDMAAHTFVGNYDAYLKQNTTNTTTKIHEYEVGKRTLENLHKQIQIVRAKKASTGKNPNPFIPLEKRLLKEYTELEARLKKPTFWIDKESASGLAPKLEQSYQKHKSKSIRIRHNGREERQRDLLRLENVQAGYGKALFQPITLTVQTGDRLQIIGRNGVGKTTLVKTLIDYCNGQHPETLLAGVITFDPKLVINSYEQEIDATLLDMALGQAIAHIYDQYDLSITSQDIMRLLGEYLFDPYGDREQPVRSLSGGQKARLQLIKLFANQPNLIIVDEPTNHLDLPSIEELEHALTQYAGALLYISHDSYFARQLAGKQLHITPLS